MADAQGALIASAPIPDIASQLPIPLKLGWGIGAFGVAMLVNGISVLIFFYLVAILKIEPALAGAIIFVSKLFDVFIDPFVGLWSDRIKSPRGRRRPFLFWGAFVSAASFALIFTTPIFANQWLTAGYVLVALCIYAGGYTLFNIPYLAMPAEMTDNYHERSSIHAYRIVFVSLGSFLAASIAPAMIEQLGKTEASSYATIGLASAALIFGSMMASYLTTAKARFTPAHTGVSRLSADVSAIAGNRLFLRLIGVKFAQLLGMQTTQAAMIFFVIQSLQLKLDIFVIFGIVTTITSILVTPLMIKFSKRYGKRNTYYLAAACNIAYSLSWSLAGPGEPDWAIALRAFIVGIAVVGNVVMAMSMLTDIINLDARRTGVRREGTYTAMYSFVEKVTAAIGPLIIGFALSLAGFNNKLPPDVPQGGDVDKALLFAVSWLPAFFGFVAVWLLSGYKLTEKDINAVPDKSAGGAMP